MSRNWLSHKENIFVNFHSIKLSLSLVIILHTQKADWSKQYILNIMDIKSTYDCADAGIRVVVKYPACIMDNDRVRLYGRLPADVHSIARPTRYLITFYPTTQHN